MLLELAPYLFLLMLGGTATVLLTSKKIAEKLVAAGMLPHAFLGLLPVIQSALRILGGVLVVAGVVKIGIDSGWIDGALLSRYAFPAAMILLGLLVLLLSRRGGK